MLSSKRVTGLVLTFRSLIHLGLMFVCVKVRSQASFFCIWPSCFRSTVHWKDYSFTHLIVLISLLKNQVIVNMRAYFPILKIIKINSIDLYVDIYVYQTVSYCFVVTFEIKKYEPSKFVLFLGGFGYFGGSDGNASSCNAGDPGSIPGLGRSPGEGNSTPLQYSCLENSMDRGAW